MTNYSKKGRDYERLVAKDYGGECQPGSGCHWSSKSDIKTSNYLIETKFTTKEIYVLKYKDLSNCFNYAYRQGKHPIFQIGFYGGEEFVIVDATSFEDLIKTKYDPIQIPEVLIKSDAKSKSFNKYELPEISSMIYNRLRVYIITKKIFKELINE